MATAENARLQYEAGQQATGMTALTDTGDATTFASPATLWSGRSGYAPVVRLNGLLTGGAVAPKAATDDAVTVAALSANLNGTVANVAANDVTVQRGSAGNVARITSITVAANGSLAAVAGTAHAALSETRGAPGGPPLIPVDSIEVAQVRLTSTAAAPVQASEVYQVVGVHRDRADFPLSTTSYETGKVTFLAPLTKDRVGNLPRKVFASYSAPIFADVALASDFVPPETSNSVSSTQIYGTTLGSTSSTLGQGSFTAYLNDGVTDPLVQLKNQLLWFRFYPDKYKTPHLLTQGKLGISRTFPAADQLAAACTISASSAAIEVA